MKQGKMNGDWCRAESSDVVKGTLLSYLPSAIITWAHYSYQSAERYIYLADMNT